MEEAANPLGPLGSDVRPHRPSVELLLLAAPTVAQMASYTLMQFIDTWMLAKVGVGVHEPTAAANSGMIAFAVIAMGVGSLFLVNALVSQSFGRHDYHACGRYLWQGIWFAVLFSAATLVILPLAEPIFRTLGHEPRLVRLEAVYLQVAVGLAVVKLVATAIGQFMLAINRPGSVLLAAVVGVSANVVAAWALIFGELGSPPLGVVGAAWAQNIGVTVELLVLVWLVTRPQVRRRFNVADWRPRAEQMRTLVKLGFPSGVQVLTDVLAWSMFQMWVVGVFGTVAMAANTYVFRYMSVSFMPAFGISQAITALVGRYIGMGRPDLAERRAHLGFVMSALYMVACGVVLYLGRHLLISLFTQDQTVLSLGATLLVFAAIYQFFDALYIAYNGALRGAGDTLFPAIATAVLCWGIAVVGGRLVAVYVPALGVLGPWFAAMAYGVIMGIVILARFLRGGWKRIDVEHEPTAGPGFPVVITPASPTAAAADAE